MIIACELNATLPSATTLCLRGFAEQPKAVVETITVDESLFSVTSKKVAGRTVLSGMLVLEQISLDDATRRTLREWLASVTPFTSSTVFAATLATLNFDDCSNFVLENLFPTEVGDNFVCFSYDWWRPLE